MTYATVISILFFKNELMKQVKNQTKIAKKSNLFVTIQHKDLKKKDFKFSYDLTWKNKLQSYRLCLLMQEYIYKTNLYETTEFKFFLYKSVLSILQWMICITSAMLLLKCN